MSFCRSNNGMPEHCFDGIRIRLPKLGARSSKTLRAVRIGVRARQSYTWHRFFMTACLYSTGIHIAYVVRVGLAVTRPILVVHLQRPRSLCDVPIQT